MEPEAGLEENAGTTHCPECGAEESGYFCRNCGALLRGADLVLCPRCHQIVPDGQYCNQCGQSLSGAALPLRQLAPGGGVFQVPSPVIPGEPSPAESQPDPSAEEDFPPLEEAERADRLQETPAPAAPDQAPVRVYPALQPVPSRQAGKTWSRCLVWIILLMSVILLALLGVAIYVLIQAGWYP
jgi:hypothetical protein